MKVQTSKVSERKEGPDAKALEREEGPDIQIICTAGESPDGHRTRAPQFLWLLAREYYEGYTIERDLEVIHN